MGHSTSLFLPTQVLKLNFYQLKLLTATAFIGRDSYVHVHV